MSVVDRGVNPGNKSADRHVASLGHIILIPRQPVFALSPYCCILSREATNTNFIVFDLTRSGLTPRSTTLMTSLLILYYIIYNIKTQG
jgi:hypothetical protein